MLAPAFVSNLSARAPRRRARTRCGASGFTLVELMVAVTGGLFVSIIVFSIAKNSARFYQSETRVGEATLAGIVGFERLRADVARAGFLASPNILADPRVCAGPATVSGFPTLLATLSSVRVDLDATDALNNANLHQDNILLAGSFSSIDYFPMRVFAPAQTGYSITLHPTSGAMTRLGYDPAETDMAARDAILLSVFGVGRAVRIVDRSDKHYYGIVSGVNTQAPTEPAILLAVSPAIQTQQAGQFCGMDQCEGCVINVVNFIRYDVSHLRSNTAYAPLYTDAGAAPFDDTRTELRRVELDPTSAGVIAGTEELVTQYAVDLKFGLLVDARGTASAPDLETVPFGHEDIEGYTAPHRIRGVRVRLSVRTRDADRETDIDPSTAGVPDGLYRVGLGPDGTKPFARVRTLQADVMLNNTASIPW